MSAPAWTPWPSPALYEVLAALVRERVGSTSPEKLALIAEGAPLPPTEGYGGLGQREAALLMRAMVALAKARGEPHPAAEVKPHAKARGETP